MTSTYCDDDLAPGWVYVSSGRLPAFNTPVFVVAKEFGCTPVMAIATCWVSSEMPLLPKWYLDRNFYNLDNLLEIAQTVICWHSLPEIPAGLK